MVIVNAVPLQRTSRTRTKTPSISKPLAEYLLANLDGLGFARSSPLLLKTSRRFSLPFTRRRFDVYSLSLLCCSGRDIRRFSC